MGWGLGRWGRRAVAGRQVRPHPLEDTLRHLSTRDGREDEQSLVHARLCAHMRVCARAHMRTHLCVEPHEVAGTRSETWGDGTVRHDTVRGIRDLQARGCLASARRPRVLAFRNLKRLRFRGSQGLSS